MKTNIKITIWEIKIDEKEQYYSFPFGLFIDEKEYDLLYEHDYSNQSWDDIKKRLENWFAMECICEYLYSNSSSLFKK